MEIISSIARWLFVESIYGIVVVAAAVYLTALGIKKVIPKLPNPFALAAIAFVVAICTVPSLPRYQFEDEALSQIEGREWVRVINKTNWGSLTEPLTWFHAPVGSVFMVMPNTQTEGGFREVLLRYQEQPQIRMSDPDCSGKTILYSEADNAGVFREISKRSQPMSEQEYSIYCEYDWSKEKEALRVETLKQIHSK